MYSRGQVQSASGYLTLGLRGDEALVGVAFAVGAFLVQRCTTVRGGGGGLEAALVKCVRACVCVCVCQTAMGGVCVRVSDYYRWCVRACVRLLWVVCARIRLISKVDVNPN